MEQSALFENIFSVSQLNSIVKESLEGFFKKVKVEGEISGFKRNSSGHCYFTLKDNTAAISAVLFKFDASKLDFSPSDGDKVTVTGRVSLYEPRGTYQLICSDMQKSGLGDILLELEKRKKEFAAKGYFSRPKREIPCAVRTVAVVTSPTGAVIHDIINARTRRDKSVSILLIPANVQGEGAAAEIADGITIANAEENVDVIIVGRGGGSIEDLLPFSDELVVAAVADSRVPVISAVGHEVDWALCDFAADKRASTPTAAAELAIAEKENKVDKYKNLIGQLSSLMSYRIQSEIQRFDITANELDSNMKQRLCDERSSLDRCRVALEALSPLSVLERGYSIVTTEDGRHTISSSEQIPAGTEFRIRFNKGSVAAVSKGEI